MSLIYVIENYLADLTIGSYSLKSTHATYIATNLANERPSLPYRTAGRGTAGDPEYICVNLGAEKEISFVGVFNHNLTTTPNLFTFEACNGNCENCPCGPKNMTDPQSDPCDGCPDTGELVADFKNTYQKINCSGTYNHCILKMADTGITDVTYIEVGELVVGKWKRFPRGPLDSPAATAWVRLSPGRADGPEFFMGNQRTHYGQDWSTYYSECERFDLTFTTQNDPCLVDAVHAFLKNVQRTGGRFVLVPDDTKPFCYYVIIDNLRDYAERLIYGRTGELREWRLRLKTLTEGVQLL